MSEKNPILLVDDDEDDRFIFQEGFVQAGCRKRFIECDSGAKLIDYLKSSPREEFPSMILLDLNMPLTDGKVILNEIKSNPDWVHIPVIVFTTSRMEKDRSTCYRYGANCFVTKPSAYDEVLNITRAIALLWCLNG